MRPIIFIPLLAIFVVPSGINLLSRDLASPFNPSPSAPVTAARDVSNEPSRVSTTPEPPASTPSAPAAADESSTAALEAAVAASPGSEGSSQQAPTLAPAPQEDFVACVETEVLRLTNDERTKQGLSALAPDSKLHDVAQAHSDDMLTDDYFSHDDQSGCSSSCRATNAGYRWKAIGENIYMMSGYKMTPEQTAAMMVDGWMNSPGHRKNILNESFTESGVGLAVDGKSIYVTSMYGKPR